VLIRIQMWIYRHFSTSINIMLIGLSTIYSHSTGGATVLLSDCSRTWQDLSSSSSSSSTYQQPWRSLISLSTLCYICFVFVFVRTPAECQYIRRKTPVVKLRKRSSPSFGKRPSSMIRKVSNCINY